jgi:hypothetical protein
MSKRKRVFSEPLKQVFSIPFCVLICHSVYEFSRGPCSQANKQRGCYSNSVFRYEMCLHFSSEFWGWECTSVQTADGAFIYRYVKHCLAFHPSDRTAKLISRVIDRTIFLCVEKKLEVDATNIIGVRVNDELCEATKCERSQQKVGILRRVYGQFPAINLAPLPSPIHSISPTVRSKNINTKLLSKFT